MKSHVTAILEFHAAPPAMIEYVTPLARRTNLISRKSVTMGNDGYEEERIIGPIKHLGAKWATRVIERHGCRIQRG